MSSIGKDGRLRRVKGRMARYRQIKDNELADKLASEKNILKDDALKLIQDQRELAEKAGLKRQRARKKSNAMHREKTHDRKKRSSALDDLDFRGNPVQGGAPGLGKR